MNEQKTQPTGVEPLVFVESVEHAVRRADGLYLLELFAGVSGQPARMWGPSIVGFDEYSYRYASGHSGTAPLIGFSPRKASLSLYGLTGQPEGAALLAKLGKHKIGASCLYVNTLADVDLAVLRELTETGYAHALTWKAKGAAGEQVN
ncbi:DUF1801 domain-containing protein [Galactobacter caseinivorans]|uniref:DUF1801 domain-containing protein n=1 Tax=Galactobacter caseinivorans TaxID=2676123 RepID=A0A496PIQ0_9MICC|nr:DUF1801 domain-containing protein [Galactobacter caseinivorans]RKW70376.1 DUF1801 domain-containing protein [Galactobacter caseinivorans]